MGNTAYSRYSQIFGLWFAYFGHNWIWHGVFIFGDSLMFFGGILLAVALWPGRPEYRIEKGEYASSKKGLDLELTAFFVMAVATLGSALFGAIPGAFTGNGFETFLAEDIVGSPGEELCRKCHTEGQDKNFDFETKSKLVHGE